MTNIDVTRIEGDSIKSKSRTRLHVRIRLAVGLFFFGFASAGRCTIVVALSLPDQIVFAADSAISYSQATDKEERHTRFHADSRCKLAWGKDYVVGLSGDYDPKLLSAANQAAVTKGTPTDKANVLDGLIRTVAPNVLEQLKKVDPTTYKAILRGQNLLECIIGGFENGVSVLVGRLYSVSPTGSLKIISERRPTVPGRLAGLFLGDGNAKVATIERFESDPGWWRRVRLAEEATVLVQTGINAAPQSCGPPISIVELTAAGIRWISCGQCQCR